MPISKEKLKSDIKDLLSDLSSDANLSSSAWKKVFIDYYSSLLVPISPASPSFLAYKNSLQGGIVFDGLDKPEAFIILLNASWFVAQGFIILYSDKLLFPVVSPPLSPPVFNFTSSDTVENVSEHISTTIHNWMSTGAAANPAGVIKNWS